VGCQGRAGQVDGPLWIRRPRAIDRKNYLFAGCDAGSRRAAAIYLLIESAKLNSLNPQHYLADVLARIADHLAPRIAEFLPWNWQLLDATRTGPLTERLQASGAQETRFIEALKGIIDHGRAADSRFPRSHILIRSTSSSVISSPVRS
jgi:hypothetical protein